MAKGFSDYLKEIRGGTSDIDAGKVIRDINKSVLESGKKGTFAFVLTFEPDKHDETAVKIQPSFKYSIPKKAYAPGYFYVNQSTGDATKDDPRQLELLKEKEAEREAERERQRAEGVVHLEQVGRG